MCLIGGFDYGRPRENLLDLSDTGLNKAKLLARRFKGSVFADIFVGGGPLDLRGDGATAGLEAF